MTTEAASAGKTGRSKISKTNNKTSEIKNCNEPDFEKMWVGRLDCRV